jgi:hypothetical protein
MDEFLGRLEAEANRLQDLNGSMSRVFYNKHYLPAEALNKIDQYTSLRTRNKKFAVRQLLGAIVATMGQFSKTTDYEGKRDLNLDYIQYLKEQSLIQKKNGVVLDIRGAIGSLVLYNNLIETDKRKAAKALIDAGVALMTEFRRVEG